MVYTKAFILVFISLFATLISNAQPKIASCTDVKNGVFYSYPKNSADRYIISRDEKYSHDRNLMTGDTTLWEMKWTGDCTYTLKYVSGNAKIDDETLKVLRKHKLVYEISAMTANYYVFKGYLDKISNVPIQTDTMWFNEKVYIPQNEIFNQIASEAALRKSRFSDTSQYAVLYVYRPGKFSQSLNSPIIYFDDNIMCVSENNSGYMFKILKEGKFEIKSKLAKSEFPVKLDVKFGKRYYIKHIVHWAVGKNLSTFKLDLQLMDPKDGRVEFLDVDVH